MAGAPAPEASPADAAGGEKAAEAAPAGSKSGEEAKLEGAALAAAHDAKPRREPAQLDREECVAYAVGEKEVGNVAFKAQDWETAVGRYEQGLRYALFFHQDPRRGGELTEEEKKVAVALLSNTSAAQFKQGRYEQAVEACTKAICLDMFNVKVYFRRAQAFVECGKYTEAHEDCLRALDLDPENVEAKQMRSRVAAAARRVKQKDKQVYSKMFA